MIDIIVTAVSNFLYWFRDVMCVVVFGGIMLACMLHDFKARFWYLFPEEKKPVVPVVRKKFQGSAATFVP